MKQIRSRKQEVENDFQKYMHHPFMQCDLNASSQFEDTLLARNRGVNYEPRDPVKSLMVKEVNKRTCSSD
jgi:hypothetical protein